MGHNQKGTTLEPLGRIKLRVVPEVAVQCQSNKRSQRLENPALSETSRGNYVTAPVDKERSLSPPQPLEGPTADPHHEPNVYRQKQVPIPLRGNYMMIKLYWRSGTIICETVEALATV